MKDLWEKRYSGMSRKKKIQKKIQNRIAFERMERPMARALDKILLRWRDELEVEALDKEMAELRRRLLTFFNQPN